MLWIAVVIVAVLAVLAVAGLVSYMSRRPQRGAASGEPIIGTRPRISVAEFHVRGEDALVTFDVPLPAGEPDQVLVDLLMHEAVEVTREKRHELPIDQVTHVVALGKRNGEAVEVGRVTLATPGQLPPPAPPEVIVHASRVGYDPLAAYHESAREGVPAVAEPSPEKKLGAVGAELRLPASIEAGLRTQGLDPEVAGAGDLAKALLQLSGYQVAPAGDGGTFVASKGALRTYVRVIDHEPGSYPVLGEQPIAEFVVDFISSGADRGLLVTDKYGPYEVYQREKREPRVRFVTRERLQGFVDAYLVS